MHLNNYHNPEEKIEKTTERTDPEDIIQKLKDIFNYLQNLRNPFKK